MQIAQFALPRYGQQVINDTLPARYLRSEKEELPVDHVRPFSSTSFIDYINLQC